MASPVQTKTPGEKAADEFTAYFKAELNNSDRWTENGDEIRLTQAETTAIQSRYAQLQNSLTSTVDQSAFYNRVATLLGDYDTKTNKTERARVNAMANRLAGAFNQTAGGVQLRAPDQAPTGSGIDLKDVSTSASAIEVFKAFLTAEDQDNVAWTVKVPDNDPNAQFNGQRVQFTTAETNRIKSLISEIFAKLPRDEAMDFSNQATLALNRLPTNGYEKARTIPQLLDRVSRETAAK